MPTIEIRDTTLYYESAGRGTPLLFIHGMCGDADVWRGHTRSALGDRAESVQTHAEDAAALITTLGVRPVAVGSSGGARIAVELSRRHPRPAGRRGPLRAADLQPRPERGRRTGGRAGRRGRPTRGERPATRRRRERGHAHPDRRRPVHRRRASARDRRHHKPSRPTVNIPCPRPRTPPCPACRTPQIRARHPRRTTRRIRQHRRRLHHRTAARPPCRHRQRSRKRSRSPAKPGTGRLKAARWSRSDTPGGVRRRRCRRVVARAVDVLAETNSAAADRARALLPT